MEGTRLLPWLWLVSIASRDLDGDSQGGDHLADPTNAMAVSGVSGAVSVRTPLIHIRDDVCPRGLPSSSSFIDVVNPTRPPF